MYIVGAILSFFKALDNPATRALAGLASVGIIMGFILWLLPTYALPEELENSLTWLFQTLWQFNFVFPIGDILWAGFIIIMFDVAVMAIKFGIFAGKWIFKNN